MPMGRDAADDRGDRWLCIALANPCDPDGVVSITPSVECRRRSPRPPVGPDPDPPRPPVDPDRTRIPLPALPDDTDRRMLGRPSSRLWPDPFRGVRGVPWYDSREAEGLTGDHPSETLVSARDPTLPPRRSRAEKLTGGLLIHPSGSTLTDRREDAVDVEAREPREEDEVDEFMLEDRRRPTAPPVVARRFRSAARSCMSRSSFSRRAASAARDLSSCLARRRFLYLPGAGSPVGHW